MDLFKLQWEQPIKLNLEFGLQSTWPLVSKTPSLLNKAHPKRLQTFVSAVGGCFQVNFSILLGWLDIQEDNYCLVVWTEDFWCRCSLGTTNVHSGLLGLCTIWTRCVHCALALLWRLLLCGWKVETMEWIRIVRHRSNLPNRGRTLTMRRVGAEVVLCGVASFGLFCL